jgi:acid phosphatase type 7
MSTGSLKRQVIFLLTLVGLSISGIFATEPEAVATTNSLLSTTDTKIGENAPTKNYGNATTLSVNGNVGKGKDESALLKWDTSGIAPGTKVNSASITLTVSNSSTETYQAYKLKRPWVESKATWANYDTSKPWQVAGANGALDRDATVVGTIKPTATGKQTFTITPYVVQGWVDDPSSNQGIILANTTNTDGFDFYSRESTTSSQRPMLTLDLGATVDTTSPDTKIDSGPSGTVSGGSASFSFSSTETGSTFECARDSGAYASCTSPESYTGLSEGSHTFQVRATDAAGNTDATPASQTWTIDATPPTVSSVAPADPATDVAPTANAEVTFSEDMDSSTLTASTFTLAKQGSTSPVGAAVSYDSATKKATLNPDADLEASTTYTATVTSGSGGAKDLAGNPLASDKTWSFTTAAPQVSPTTVSIPEAAGTYIDEYNPNTNYGTATSFKVDGDQPTGTGKDAYVLARYDTSSIPANATIQAARIKMNVSNSSTQAYEVYALKKSLISNEATWINEKSSTPWEMPGAKGASDRDGSTVLGYVQATTAGAVYTALNSAGIAKIQEWVKGTQANNGLIIANPSNTDGLDFAKGSVLEVTYGSSETVTPPPPPATGSTTLIGAGDIADSTDADERTAKILDANPEGTVFTAGDNAYYNATLSEFNSYYEPTWGRHKARTRPTPGNHEYYTSGASGYYSYFSNFPKTSSGGNYSYDIGEWHVVALDTGQCEANTGLCSASSALLSWLDADLRAHTNKCTMAIFHHPRFSSGGDHSNDSTRAGAIWEKLYAFNADVVVNGHSHNYERFAPQNPSGVLDTARGIREFVVGTGGRAIDPLGTVKANSEVRNFLNHGVIKFNLKSGGYDAQFIGTDLGVKDSTSGTCH